MQVTEREAAGQGLEGGPAQPDAQMESPAPPKSPAFDLFSLVLSSKRLEMYLEPLGDAWEGIHFLLRWQMPLCSLLTCLGLNFLLLTLTEAAWFSLCALLVLVPALLGYLQEACRARRPAPELVRQRYHSVRREDLQQVRLARHEAVTEVPGVLSSQPLFSCWPEPAATERGPRVTRPSARVPSSLAGPLEQQAPSPVILLNRLIHLEGFLSWLCYACEGAYRVLHWETPALSSQFYGALLGSLCVLYLLPFCWVLALLNSTLFLGNAEFYRVLLELKAAMERRLGPKPLASTLEPVEPDAGAEGGSPLVDRTPTPTSTEDLTPGSVEEAEEAEPDEEFKDAIEEDDEVSQCSAVFDLGLPDGSSVMSKNEVIRSKVSRLTERLRKRCPSNNFGSCTRCAATFSVLKKRALLSGQSATGTRHPPSVPPQGPAAVPCLALGPGCCLPDPTESGRSCSNCGNSFCSRCCSYKVPKSSMGATAPDAQRETVFVCSLCNQVLVK
ncbi:protrudin isoform X2 [Lepidochelys kempii]|uniref:protrudin isoform X2 n=1 Tax=Lepidochelys kempii TaxID=8472 RepID=UPI003C6FF7ED